MYPDPLIALAVKFINKKIKKWCGTEGSHSEPNTLLNYKGNTIKSVNKYALDLYHMFSKQQVKNGILKLLGPKNEEPLAVDIEKDLPYVINFEQPVTKTLACLALQEYVKLWNKKPSSCLVLEYMEKVITEYFKTCAGNDVKMWQKLALIEFTVPLADYETAIKCLEKALSLDKLNITTLLITAYIKDHYSGIDKEFVDVLESLNPSNAEEEAAIIYATTWYYKKNNQESVAEELLRKSISVHPGFVRSHADLGDLYLEKGSFDAYYHYKRALENIKYISVESDILDITDVSGFINEYIKGTDISDSNAESLREKVYKIENA